MRTKRRCPQRYGLSLRRRNGFPVRHQPESQLLTQADFDRMYPVFGSKIRYTIATPFMYLGCWLASSKQLGAESNRLRNSIPDRS